ncbi:MAG: hypothetical protein ABFC24_09845 [Methanoregulaceae archaeon]
MPDVTKTEIGRRMYQLHKDKNVEKAVEKIRGSLGGDWKSFSDEDIETLKIVLAEIWVNTEQVKWDKIPFGRITRDQVRMILSSGKLAPEMPAEHKNSVDKLKVMLSRMS